MGKGTNGRTGERTNGRAGRREGAASLNEGTDENVVRIAGENRAEDLTNESRELVVSEPRASRERGRERTRARERKRAELEQRIVDLKSGVDTQGVVNFPIVPFPTVCSHWIPGRHEHRAGRKCNVTVSLRVHQIGATHHCSTQIGPFTKLCYTVTMP